MYFTRRDLVFLLLGAALLFGSSAVVAAQGCATGPPFGLGTVTVLGGCPEGVEPLPGTSCQQLGIDCAGLQPINVLVRVTEPAPGATARGTVLLGTGGGGTEFYGDSPSGAILVATLVEQGFRVVDRKWSVGWFFTDVGVRRQSCRYATLATWVHDNLHDVGAFCVSGNSGGSAEIGYALTTWGLDTIIDVAVPSAGPPMTRLDYLCPEPTPPEWVALCPTLPPPGVMQCESSFCDPEPGAPFVSIVCTSCSATPSLADLREDSILHLAAQTQYPSTRVHFVWGTMDCGGAVPAGLLWANAITSEKVLEFAPDTPHEVFTTPEGRHAIFAALLAGASCPTGPATTNAPTWPSVGGSLHLVVNGPPGGNYIAALGPESALIDLPPYGVLFLPKQTMLASGTLDLVTGQAVVSFAVPNLPALAGLDVYNQALSGPCLTNLLRVVVLP